MAMPVAEARNVRSRDLRGTKFKWTDLKIVHEFTKGPYKGHAVAYVDHPDDTALLGRTMGHCAGTHFIWTCEERIWAFFTIVTTDDLVPHTTLHAKQLKWVGKQHPRDIAPTPYAKRYVANIRCEDCQGYGGHRASRVPGKKGSPWYYGDPGIIKCEKCNGAGSYPPPVEKVKKGEQEVPRPKASAGGYPTYADVVAAFESVGRKYEAGKWGPLQFSSQTYEIPKNYKEAIMNFDGRFGRSLLKERPAGVGDSTWKDYKKAVAAVKAEFDKGNGAVQIVGRTFKFDGKEWYVLSFSGKGQAYDGGTQYRGMMHEFFIECNKRKKESDGK